jgi:adenylosuccinate lyase
MHAVAQERPIVLEERVAKIESDVSFMRADLSELKADQREIRQDLKAVAHELSAFKTDVAQRFGAVNLGIEAVRTSIEQSKRWVIATGVSAGVAGVGLVGTLVAVGRALKWF